MNENEIIMVVRFVYNRKYDFIAEHTNILKMNGTVWMLKAGRKIPFETLEKVLFAGGHLILKAPKQSGGKYYISHFSKYRIGRPLSEMVYPEYYKSISNEDDRDLMDGTWLLVDHISELEEKYIPHLFLCKNKRRLNDVINQTRTSILYAYWDGQKQEQDA